MDPIEVSSEPAPVVMLGYAKQSIPGEWATMVWIVAMVGLVVAAGRLLMLAAYVSMFVGRVASLQALSVAFAAFNGASGIALTIACLLLLTGRSRTLGFLWWTELLTLSGSTVVGLVSLVMNWSEASFRAQGYFRYYLAFYGLANLFVTGGFSLIVILLARRIAKNLRAE